ncbi:similar to Saccharomyces cerevisiae YLR181C VTA1 Multivesicular body (MVB) protein involved in endosomal protein sorting [Maudiozyma barnettii]|uniref:Similar to Saccharomyces cerevisiae YLR181C VTA1 Multivesicular body (MVB) protein involved in endosomal protein sorting n=1 Tax=Maudiozyma barnettii TaxID=61262 RepID=A0A8H2ZIR5_9SACH|nr:Vta1p [Kazachstania barnettii]CAB4253314.1 similar to Saccharomyces cerevisiae YLR181C VTA1 Multivesicular body (MVB) protein involved in endosomal protein sorting [Kazachstania barnettii]CAD1780820.1 similar to Saccharomyces cerevisiae YLR181C VTA1 Multivesicular body (MVB) protein involved in endosomal protein sorting [Kazachstania barnettii]
MDFNNRLKREIKRAEEFDTAGLGIISYYLRLYIVEVLLKRDDRTAEQTHLASDILDKIESFKQSINELSDDSREKETLFTLVNDDVRAKTYVTNFTMSLYNQQLVRVQKGPWDRDLVGALWCCIDLLNCIMHLWSSDDESRQTLTKRIKFCKVYISRIVKGEIGPPDNAESDENDKKEDHIQPSNEDTTTTNLNIISGNEETNNNQDTHTQDHPGIEDAIDEYNENRAEINDSTHESDNEEEEENDTILDDDLQKELASMSLEEHPEPTFIDSDSDSEIPQGNEIVEDSETKHTTQELNGMMDRSEKIEQAQKCAKYAISALNYEDIGTAKDEFTKAMKLLDSLS